MIATIIATTTTNHHSSSVSSRRCSSSLSIVEFFWAVFAVYFHCFCVSNQIIQIVSTMAEINNNKIDPIEGKYKLEKSENFDQFLDRLGVGFLSKTAARTLKPTFVVKADENNQFTFAMLSTFKNTEIKFKPGEEFEEDRLDGKRVKTVIERENENKFVQIQKDGKQQVEIIREFKGDEVHVWATCDGATSFRLYRRIPE